MKNFIIGYFIFFTLNVFGISLLQDHENLLNIHIPDEVILDFSLFPNLKDKPNSQEIRTLIEAHIDPAQKNPEPIRDWDHIKNKGKLYAEGTGTRDGGSGILTKVSEKKYEVLLLDVHRSLNLEQFKLFYEPDPELMAISASKEEIEISAEKIYSRALERTKVIFPVLEQTIRAAEVAMPRKNWVASVSDLPLIDDFIGEAYLKNNQRQVQIAYRHANQIIYNEKLYILMNAYNRAALRLHEYIYASSNLKTSVQVQRLVSLLMSLKFKDPAFITQAKQILVELHLAPLAIPSLHLPPEASLTEESPGADKICGLLNNLKIKEDQNLEIEFRFDPKNLELTREGMSPEKLMLMQFTKTNKIELKKKDEMQKFLLAFYFGKSYLSKKYPIYLYPAQSLTSDIICVHSSDPNKISSIEMSVRFHERKNEVDLNAARIEADLFKTQREYVLRFSEQNKSEYAGRELEMIDDKMQIGSELFKLKLSQQSNLAESYSLSVSGGLYLILTSQELGGLRIKF